MFIRLICCLTLSFSVFFSLEVSAQKKKSTKVKKTIRMPDENLDNMFNADLKMFELTPEEFEKQWNCFIWANKEKKIRADFLSVNHPIKLTIFGVDVWEAIADFKDGKFSQMKVSLYNRGDAESSVKRVNGGGYERRDLNSGQFKKLLKDIDGKLNILLEVKGKQLPPVIPVKGSDNKIYRKYWVKDGQSFGLEWNVKQNGQTIHPEYLNFVYLKFDPIHDPRRQTTFMRKTGKLNKTKKLKDNLATKDGFKYIDNIPMIDQGPKGYCAAAATARILQYYGSEQDMHSVGQIIKVTAAGTNPVEMLKQLKKATPQLGTKVYSYLDPPEFGEHYSGDTKKYIRDYESFNKLLKKNNMSQIQMGYPMVACARGEKLEVYKEFMTKQKRAYYKKFLANIKKNIDQGIPVAWGLFLGFVKENGKNPQAMGGHMRLIIGYNKDMSQLVFTDTWGAGHEFKTIDSADAWIVTSFYGILKPKR